MTNEQEKPLFIRFIKATGQTILESLGLWSGYFIAYKTYHDMQLLPVSSDVLLVFKNLETMMRDIIYVFIAICIIRIIVRTFPKTFGKIRKSIAIW